MDGEIVDAALQGHHGAGDQMGFDRPVLADQAAGRGPAGVEVAQGDDVQAVGGAGVGQDLLAP